MKITREILVETVCKVFGDCEAFLDKIEFEVRNPPKPKLFFTKLSQFSHTSHTMHTLLSQNIDRNN